MTDDEHDSVLGLLGREPRPAELAMYSVMWSEHCSYKSSRKHLGRFPTEAPWVVVGPGENPGVVDLGDGWLAALRIESHNHPSFVEPYQGAATGVGGILRDVFTMGARPIALWDQIRFGPLDDPKNRYLFNGVVSGIAGYGNAVGVPTVGGEMEFDPCYSGNPLVNVMCLGVMRREQLTLGTAGPPGTVAVLLGRATGRDGIGGASVLASASFDEESQEKRPSVQVGDPFEEKKLIEACLEMYQRGLVAGVQDLGAAGLSCATSEPAGRAGVGMEVDLDAVHVREEGMTAPELLMSESQERMMAFVPPENVEEVIGIADRWEIEATVIGTVRAGATLIVRHPWPMTPPSTTARCSDRRGSTTCSERRPVPSTTTLPRSCCDFSTTPPWGLRRGSTSSTTTCCSSTPWSDPDRTVR
jgi:phosphoribosylformylglycinamidine synthase